MIDHLRAVEGTAVAALVRDRVGHPTTAAGLPRKVSLRASDDRVDVSAIARAQGGGGHRQAAGFSTAMQWDELVEFLRREVAQQLSPARTPASASRRGDRRRRPVRQAGRESPRTTSWRRCARAAVGSRVKVGHAGTLDPFATGLLLVLVGRATRVQRFLMALPKTYEATARFGAVSNTGDPDGEITVTGVVPAGDLALPTGLVRQRPPAFSAVKVGGRRAYALARAGETVELAEREVHVYRFEERWREGERRSFVIECSSGTYVRSLIADLGDAYCERAAADRDRSVRRWRRGSRADAGVGRGAGVHARGPAGGRRTRAAPRTVAPCRRPLAATRAEPRSCA